MAGRRRRDPGLRVFNRVEADAGPLTSLCPAAGSSPAIAYTASTSPGSRCTTAEDRTAAAGKASAGAYPSFRNAGAISWARDRSVRVDRRHRGRRNFEALFRLRIGEWRLPSRRARWDRDYSLRVRTTGSAAEEQSLESNRAAQPDRPCPKPHHRQMEGVQMRLSLIVATAAFLAFAQSDSWQAHHDAVRSALARKQYDVAVREAKAGLDSVAQSGPSDPRYIRSLMD